MFLHTIPENELVTPVLDVFDRKILHNQQVGLYVLFDSFCTNVFGKEGDFIFVSVTDQAMFA